MLLVEGVSKTFPRPAGLQRWLIRSAAPEAVEALRGVNLTVQRGEVVGLVGPNGAGKTTLMKIVSTLLDQTSGSVTVDGFDTRSNSAQVRSRLGLVLADDRSLYWRLTGRQNLEFFAVMNGMVRRDAQVKAGQMLERVGLASRDKMVFGYSSGMRARLSIARAFLNEPPLLLLDEPTRALDPLATQDVANLIREAALAGVAILLSSHRLDEIETVCDRISVILQGATRFDGTAVELAGSGSFSTALRAMLAENGSVEDR
jgi:ABC-2 type transport system ATP-binding protein